MALLRQIYYTLPPRFRFLARRLYFLPLDIYEQLSGKRPPMTPPRGMIFIGERRVLEWFSRLLTLLFLLFSWQIITKVAIL